jgi:curved DNA-binding protein CbpA
MRPIPAIASLPEPDELADALDPYKVLQVDSEAEDEVIQAAYRRLAQKYPPDRAAGPEAAARMIAINAAWELIGEPEVRAAYDRSRKAPASPAPSAPSAPTPRPASAAASPPQPRAPRPPETVSRDWTTGRSTHGGGYDEKTMRSPDGFGAAGPPPGRASGSVLNFGRYAGWSLGEITRADIEYIEWLDRMPIGRPYRDEIDLILRRAGRRKSATTEADQRRGLFRRR